MSNGEISKIKAMLRRYKSSLPKFTIFVLGPGEHNRDPYAKKCYIKRCQIKDELARDHYVFFLEEIIKKAEKDGKKVPNILVFEELILKKDPDTVVMIFVLNALGLQAELVSFSKDPELSAKMLVFYDSTYYKFGKKGFWYVNDALDLIKRHKGRIVPFKEREIDKCSLLTKVKKIVEQERSVLSILPYKKYRRIE